MLKRKIWNCLLPAVLILPVLLGAPGCATLKNTDLSGLLGQGPLDEATVAAGLRDALRVGTENSVLSTSRPGGFLDNELIRVNLPDQLTPVASTLRKLGLGSHVDALEAAMNRAAEQAAGQAKSVFWTAITEMSIADAFSILRGNDTAATDYFQAKTSTRLRARFGPIVSSQISSLGLADQYNQVVDTYNAVPLTSKPELVDLNEYVTDRTLEGLFTVLAREEQKIRHDPLARTTDLLKRVFGP